MIIHNILSIIIVTWKTVILQGIIQLLTSKKRKVVNFKRWNVLSFSASLPRYIEIYEIREGKTEKESCTCEYKCLFTRKAIKPYRCKQQHSSTHTQHGHNVINKNVIGQLNTVLMVYITFVDSVIMLTLEKKSTCFACDTPYCWFRCCSIVASHSKYLSMWCIVYMLIDWMNRIQRWTTE